MACHTPRGCALASRYKTLWGGRNRTNWAWHVVRLFVVLDQGEDVEAAQLLAAVEESELDGEGGAFDCTPELLDEFGGGGGGATGGEQVIANDHALAGLDGVFVDFERVCAVFQGIGHARGFGGELFGLSNGDETGIEAVGQSGSKNETPRFDPPYDGGVGSVLIVPRAGHKVGKHLLFLEH